MTDAEEFILSTYVPIRDLSITNISRVTLVENHFDGQKYIRRTLPKDCRDVYAILKEHSFSGIPQIMEVIYDGNTIILEEYVEGPSLSDMVSNGISQDLLLLFLTDLLNIMKWIHSHNICHRDIKEDNILVRPNQSLVLIDFAIASLSSASPEHVSFPDTLGTVTYAAPEQLSQCKSF